MKDRIKALRNELGLTQEKFADRLSIKRNTIATYEIGRNEPIDAVISLICKEFNVNEEWLRHGKGDMFVKVSEAEETEEFVKKLLTDKENDVYMLIREIMRTYEQLDGPSKAALEQFSSSLLDNLNEAKKHRDDPGITEADELTEVLNKETV